MFLAHDVIDRARSDRSHPRDEIGRRLERACKDHLALTDTSLFELPGKSFVRWRRTIEELSAMAALSPQDGYLEHLVEIVSPMANGRWREGSGFDRHLAVPWVLSALAGCLDTHADRLASDRATIEAIVVDLAEYLAHQQATTSWGDMERVAFNHTIIAYSALGSGAVALLDRHPDAPSWLDRAQQAVRRFLDVGLTDAGVTWEGITYCGYDFKYIGVFLAALRSRGIEADLVPPRSSVEAKLRRVPVWYAHDTFPRGSYLQNYNESSWDPHRAIWGFLLTFGRYEPDLCATIWDRLVGAQGLRTFGAHRFWSSLAEAMFFYPERSGADAIERLDDVFYASEVGYVSARDAWDEDASVFTFNCGPFYTRARLHDQADNNSFALVACGAPMIIDSGDGNDRRDALQATSLAHNTVLVDGLGEYPPEPGTGVSGRIIAFGSHDDAVCVVGDARDSYRYRRYNPVRRAQRTSVFVRRPFPYLVVYDDIRKDRQDHLYEFIVHIPNIDDASFDPDSGRVIVHDAEHRAIGTIDVLAPASVRASVEEFAGCGEPYLVHRLVRFATTAVNPEFVVLFRPLPATAFEPIANVETIDSHVHVTLQWETEVDTIVIGRDPVAPPMPERLPTITRSTTGPVALAWDGANPLR
jgi:hypothetical protein